MVLQGTPGQGTGGVDARATKPGAALPDDIGFLHGRVPQADLLAAARDAARRDAEPHEILLTRGALTVEDYYRALAGAVGARYAPFVPIDAAADPLADHNPSAAARVGMLRIAGGNGLRIAASPRGTRVARFVQALRDRPAAGRRLIVVPPQALTDAIAACGSDRLIRRSRTGLDRLADAMSARTRVTVWQERALWIALLVCVVLAAIHPAMTLALITIVVAAFFVGVVCVRLLAATYGFGLKAGEADTLLGDAALPVYTVLVPLYKEARQVPRLVEGLCRLDYPAHKLDIKMIAEADDAETVAALRRADLPAHFEILVVPDAKPKTKPKALCYALEFARGALVTIYDAEDLPEPDQLRRAATQLADAPKDVACIQARLAWYNWRETWITREMAIEYASLFDVFLPVLARFRLPLPLGGTSNHFRASALRAVGAWDAYNVTEDADLGLRLARAGYRSDVLDSTTWEEAPLKFTPWLRQRTRWIKGWVQTYLVHMRNPARLLADLGLRRFIAVQAVFGGIVVSAFAHPIFTGLIAWQIATGRFFDAGAGWVHWALIWLGIFSLALGYLAGFGIAVAALRQRSLAWLVPELAVLPFYWLMMSIAGIRALWQMTRDPFHWEKTEHGVSRMSADMPPHVSDRGRDRWSGAPQATARLVGTRPDYAERGRAEHSRAEHSREAAQAPDAPADSAADRSAQVRSARR